MKKHVYLGAEEGSCGLSCLRMVLSDHSKDKGYLYLDPGKEGNLSLEELIRIGEREGLRLKGFLAENKEELRKEKGPLLLVLEQEGMTHMVIYDGPFMGYARVRDPAYGKRLVPFKKLLDEWTGEGLEITGYEAQGYAGPLPEKKNSSSYLLPTIASLLGQMFLLAGFYTLATESSDVLITGGCLIGFALLQVLSEVLTGRALRKFDEEYLPMIGVTPNLREEYRFYCHYKADYFSRPIAVAANFVTACFLVVFYALNSDIFLLPIIGVVMLCAIEAFGIDPYIKERTKSLERTEKSAFAAPEETRKELLMKAAEQGHQIGRILSYKRLLGIFLLALLALGATVLGGSMSLSSFLFAVFGFWAIRKTLGATFEGMNGYEEAKAMEASFLRRYALAPRQNQAGAL